MNVILSRLYYQGYTIKVILSRLYYQNENHNLKSNSFLNLTLKNTTIAHDCEMLEYWTEKTFPDGRTIQSKEFKVILVN